ncbi:hypothetical protein HKX48_003671 [Thoreauomyces humboldtii]|nr:hypothetical protein HKX48_003671 [Thoreauomyces humboldtii]
MQTVAHIEERRASNPERKRPVSRYSHPAYLVSPASADTPAGPPTAGISASPDSLFPSLLPTADLRSDLRIQTHRCRKLEERDRSRVTHIRLLEAEVQRVRADASEATELMADVTRALEHKNDVIAGLEKQRDRGRARLAELEADNRRLNEEMRRMDALFQEKDDEIQRLVKSTEVQREQHVVVGTKLLEMQNRYEPPPLSVVDEQRALPTRALPIPKGADLQLWQLFVKVGTDSSRLVGATQILILFLEQADPYQSGTVDALQVCSILNHGPWPALDYPAARILCYSPDTTEKGIPFDSLVLIWDLLSKWIQVFLQHSTDQSTAERMPRRNLCKAMELCGVPSSEQVVANLLGQRFWNQGSRSTCRLPADCLEDFVACAARVRLMQDGFDRIDMDQDR